MENLLTIISSVTGALIGSGLLYLLVRQQLAKGMRAESVKDTYQDKQVNEIKAGAEKSIDNLARDIKDLTKELTQNSTVIKNTNGRLLQLELKLDKYADATTELKARVDNEMDFLRNLNKKTITLDDRLRDVERVAHAPMKV